MQKNDRCLDLLHSSSLFENSMPQKMIADFIEAISLTVETPFERVLNAVKDEVFDLNSSVEKGLRTLLGQPKISNELKMAIECLQSSPSRFPREELKSLLSRLQETSESQVLTEIIRRSIDRHIDLEKRLGWLMRPLEVEETQKLDPILDCDAIYHSISYEFRTEMKIFSILYELRTIIVASANSLLLTTGEFSERSVKRLTDTVILFANILEWGLDSYRGRVCIQRINEIHSRYSIPNESFKFILSGLMFVPIDWNSRFGWRPFTEIEKLGWFHAMAKVGRAMNILEISDDFNEMKDWYESYCSKHAHFGALKRKLFDQIVGQILASYSEKARPLLLSAVLAGLDEAYRSATGYPEPPEDIRQTVKSTFYCIGHLGATLPRIPWFRTLQSSKVYPHGYKVEELGVGMRSTKVPISQPIAQLPLITLEEIGEHSKEDDLWIAIDGYVYDVTLFSRNHPGGRDILIKSAGKDVSEEFAKVQHSDEAKIFMQNYRIGKLKTSSEISHHSHLAHVAHMAHLESTGTTTSGCPFSSMFSSLSIREKNERRTASF